MSPAWPQTVAAIYVPLSILSALLVAADTFVLGRVGSTWRSWTPPSGR